MPKVAVIMGSASDKDKVLPCVEILGMLGIEHEFTISSAHRTPERTERLVRSLEENGVKVFICAAGMAAHLAGAVAARTACPVIGIPLSGSSLCGMDALYSTVQMPPGYPVACMALDKAGAKNAAWLAAGILALNDPDLKKRVMDARSAMARDVEEAANSLKNHKQ